MSTPKLSQRWVLLSLGEGQECRVNTNRHRVGVMCFSEKIHGMDHATDA